MMSNFCLSEVAAHRLRDRERERNRIFPGALVQQLEQGMGDFLRSHAGTNFKKRQSIDTRVSLRLASSGT